MLPLLCFISFVVCHQCSCSVDCFSLDPLDSSHDSMSLLHTLRRRRKASMFNNSEETVAMSSIDEATDPRSPTSVAMHQLVGLLVNWPLLTYNDTTPIANCDTLRL